MFNFLVIDLPIYTTTKKYISATTFKTYGARKDGLTFSKSYIISHENIISLIAELLFFHQHFLVRQIKHIKILLYFVYLHIHLEKSDDCSLLYRMID